MIPTDTQQDIDARHATGMCSFAYNTLSAGDRGLAVTGIYLPQARVGFVYSPLILNEPLRVDAVSIEEMKNVVQAHAVELRRFWSRKVTGPP